MTLDPEKRAENSNADCAVYRTISKVAGILLGYDKDGDSTTEQMTLGRMAVLADVTPQSVHDSLLSLREMGILKLGRASVVIVDQDRMRSVMEGSCHG